MRAKHPTRWVAAIGGLLFVVTFGAGLGGPWVLDDHVNLAPVWAWLQGHRAFDAALLDNASGPLGRPLAYASFMANAQLGGAAPFGFKLTNLLVHLATTVLAALILRRLLAGSAPAAGPLAAVMLALLWALHPMQVSTVLYVVQRMTLLASFFILASVLTYLHGRALLAINRRSGQLLLFGAFPALVALGLCAKETAALAPGFALLVEIALFAGTRRPSEVRTFFLVFLALPLAAGAVYLVSMLDDLPERYAHREFSLPERLLTQPRVLGEYLVSLLMPTEGRLALYRDGYTHSQGLLAPASTLAWLAGWVTAALTAFFVRRRMPLVFLGVSWFIWGHALESSFVPLEPYFEHRNYLPSLGLWLVLFGVVLPFTSRLPTGVALAGALALVLLMATLAGARSWQWADFDRLLASEGPPAGEVSRRLQVDRAIRGFELGNMEVEAAALDTLQGSNPGNDAAAAVWRATFACIRSGAASPTIREQLLRSAPPVVTHSHVSYLMVLGRRVADDACAGLSRHDLVVVADAWIAGAEKPVSVDHVRQLSTLRD